MVSETDTPAEVPVTEISNVARRRQYKPLEPGELRRALRDTKIAVGFLGLRWAGLAKRAVFGRRQ
ncbi:MAG: hypothetical protein ABSE66_09630 [Thermoplasmata archaeon]|jgi:hypothetical protein